MLARGVKPLLYLIMYSFTLLSNMKNVSQLILSAGAKNDDFSTKSRDTFFIS